MNNIPLGPIVTKQQYFKQDYTNSSRNSGLSHSLTVNSEVMSANVLCGATCDLIIFSSQKIPFEIILEKRKLSPE